MTAIIPFSGGTVPAYLKKADKSKAAAINADVVTGAAFPHFSIKGKVFAIVRDGIRTVLKNPNDPDETAQSIVVSVLRANMKSRVFYAKRFVEGDSEGTRPTCYTYDGEAPAPDAAEPQAKKCQLCPHAVWGSRESEDGSASRGTACSSNARLAVATTDKLDEPYLLRVPPASLKNFKELVKVGLQRNIPYTAIVVKLSFDQDAASPKLTFKAQGLLSDEAYAVAEKMYKDDVVEAIVGARYTGEYSAAPESDSVGGDVLDAALAARKTDAAKAVVKSADQEPETLVEDPPANPAAAKSKTKSIEKPADSDTVSDSDDPLAGLDEMLGSLDD